MTVKKTIIYITIAIILGLGGYVGYNYYRLQQNSDLAIYIPKDADAVVYINTRQLIKNRITGKKDSLDLKSLFKQLQKSEYFRHLKSIDELGIDPFGDLAVVQYDSVWFIIAKLDDADAFKDFVSHSASGLYESIKELQDFSYTKSKKHPFFTSWNANVLIIAWNRKNRVNEMFLSKLYASDNEQSFIKSENYAKSYQADKAIWFYSNHQKLENGGKTKGYLEFGKTFKIFASDMGSPKIEAIEFRPQIPENQSMFFSDTGNHLINKGIMMLSFMNLSDIEGGNDFSPAHCRKLLMFNGPKTITKKSITYEYDDNFNKIKKETITTDTVSSCALLFRINEHLRHFSNYDFSDTGLLSQFPKEIITYLRFDESVIEQLLPFHLKVNIEYIHKFNGEFNHYQVDISIPDVKKQLLLFNR